MSMQRLHRVQHIRPVNMEFDKLRSSRSGMTAQILDSAGSVPALLSQRGSRVSQHDARHVQNVYRGVDKVYSTCLGIAFTRHVLLKVFRQE